MSTEVLVQILLMLFVVFVLARLASTIFNRFGVPGLIGEILIGIVIANLVIGDWSLMDSLGLTEGSFNLELMEVLAELGVIFLLFSVGLETRVKHLTSVGRAAILVAVLGVLVPFILGYAFILYWDGNVQHAMFMGAAMVATSVGITARVIKDMKLTDTKEARIIVGAAVIDDILGMIILAIVAGMAESGGDISIASVASIAIMAVVFVLVILLFCAKCVPKINEYMEKRKAARLEADPNCKVYSVNKLALAIAVCLGLAMLSQWIGLAAIIGAFLAGMIFADHAWEWDLEHKVESLNVFLVSFFFVNVGLKVDIGSITGQVLLLAVIIIILAIISKYIGCSLGAKFGDKELDKDSTNIIGIGMIPRGEVGIIVASIGLSYGAITGDLYTVVVLMSVVTTLIAPLFLSRAFRKKYTPEYCVTADDKI